MALPRYDSTAIDDLVAETFTRVFEAIASGGGPLVDVVPYLLVTARRLVIDRGRHQQRVVPSGSLDHLSVDRWPDEGDADGRMADGLRRDEQSVADADHRFEVAAALFALRRLRPEWRDVLVPVVMAGEPIAELAGRMGISPQALSSRLYRATEGLRQGYLRAHCGGAIGDDCRECIESMGAYVRGALRMRRRLVVERHLALCDRCRADEAALREVNAGLPEVAPARPGRDRRSSSRHPSDVD